ncbi:MAG: hypothetical protein ACYCUF_11310 [Acidimicrobiales bacterium]
MLAGISLFDPLGGLGRDVVGWFGHSIAQGIGDFAAWAIGGLVRAMDSTTTPELTSWFRGPWRAMLSVVAWLSIPILFVGVAMAALRGDLTSVIKRGLGAPVVMALGSAVAIPVTAGALVLTNACCGLLVDMAIGGNQGFGRALAHLSDFAISATLNSGGSGLPGLAAALIVALAGVGALVIWFVLALRGAILYLEVLAIPLALCGLYWDAGTHWIKRLVDLIVATILSQLVITMLMVLAAAELNSGHLSTSAGVGANMTTLFLSVAFLLLGSLALPMALKHVPAATDHAAAAAAQLSGPGRMTYMGSRIAGTAKMMGRSGGGQTIVRQGAVAGGPLAMAASAGVGAAAKTARAGLDVAGQGSTNTPGTTAGSSARAGTPGRAGASAPSAKPSAPSAPSTPPGEASRAGALHSAGGDSRG